MIENINVQGLLDENGNFLPPAMLLREETAFETMRDLMQSRLGNINEFLGKYYMKKSPKLEGLDAKAKYIMDRVQSELGLSKELAAGVAANIYVESKFNPKAVGDKGAAHGIALWHANRREGIDMLNTSFEDLVTFMINEFKVPERRALAALRMASTPLQAAAVVDERYERSSGAARKEREKMAEKYLKLLDD